MQDGRPRGILIDILKYADQELREDSFRVELYPWARAYRYASGGIGGIVGLSWTQERAALFDYSDPVYVDDVVIVVHKGKEFSFKDMTGQEIEDQLNAIFSKIGDDMAGAILPALKDMQLVGEGLFETFAREGLMGESG